MPAALNRSTSGMVDRTRSTFLGMLGVERVSLAPGHDAGSQRSAASSANLQPISKPERIFTRCLLFIPVIGPLFLCEAPSFDDAERTLQLFGLISTLLVGVASGSIDESGFTGESGSTELVKENEILVNYFNTFMLQAMPCTEPMLDTSNFAIGPQP